MAQVLQETTEWNGVFPNHIYILEGSMMIGYVRSGTTTPVFFKTPSQFSKKNRTFKEIRNHGYSLPGSKTVRVKGSKGDEYVVTLGSRPACSCMAFTYRGRCKHIDQVIAQQ